MSLVMVLQVAIEQLQQELSASRKEEEVFKEEARKVTLCLLLAGSTASFPCACFQNTWDMFLSMSSA